MARQTVSPQPRFKELTAMALDNVLLGLLKEPQSGYSLKQSFDLVFSHFWAAEISQIYRNLKGLEQRGLLKSWEEASNRGPVRRMYQRTSAGLEHLRDWLRAGPDFANRRVPYVAQTCFLHELSSESELLAFFERVREHFAARLQMLRDIDADVRAEHARHFPDGLPLDEICAHLTVNHGLYRAKALLDWSEETLEVLKERQRSSRDSALSKPLPLPSFLRAELDLATPEGEPS